MIEAQFMNTENRLVQELNKFRERFKYKDVGGGYFRDKTVLMGISADMKHGDEIIGKFCDDFVKYLSQASSND
jgi:hypothetical protein